MRSTKKGENYTKNEKKYIQKGSNIRGRRERGRGEKEESGSAAQRRPRHAPPLDN